MPLRHGAAYHWDDMGRHCIVAACGNIALWQHGAALDWGSISLGRDGVAYHWDGMGRHGTLAADLDGIPLWQHGADLDEMPLWRHGADLDGMPLQRTWMGCPCGGLGWDQHGADLDGMP